MLKPFLTPQDARRWNQVARAVGLVGAAVTATAAGVSYAAGGKGIAAGFAVVVAAAVVFALFRRPGRNFVGMDGALLTQDQITQLGWESACGRLTADKKAQLEVMRQAPTRGYFWVGGVVAAAAATVALLLGGLLVLAAAVGLMLVTFVAPQAAWWGKARQGYEQVYSQAAAATLDTTVDEV